MKKLKITRTIQNHSNEDATVSKPQKEYKINTIEGQTTIHCTVQAPASLRIWKNIRLETDGGISYKLIAVDNVAIFPTWTHVGTPGVYRFTLFFQPLDHQVKKFDLRERIPQAGGIHIFNIQRTKDDVYHLNLSE